MILKTSAIGAVVITAGLSLAACQSGSDTLAAAPERALSAATGTAEEVRAVVQSVDMDSRLVTLQGEDGSLLTFEASPDVRNLDQVEAGDIVTVTFIEAVAAAIVDPDSGESATAASAVAARAPEGDRPAAGVAAAETFRVIFDNYDPATRLATFTPSDGIVRQVRIQSPEMQAFAAGLERGEEVDVTFTEALAITVTPAEP